MENLPAKESYHLISKIIHWLTALIILGLLVVGTYMMQMDMSPQKLQFINLHKSFGLLVLTLAFVRVLWHVVHKKPKSLPTHQKWEKILSHGVHIFLYVLLFAMPLSGWIMSSAGDFNIKFFGLNVPDIVSKNEGLFKLSRESHELLAWGIFLVVALHIAGALKHHIIDRDTTLERMTWGKIGIIPLVLLIGFVGSVYGFILLKTIQEPNIAAQAVPETEQTATPIKAADNVQDQTQQQGALYVDGISQWQIDTQKSRLGFQAMQYGQTFDGSFDFDGQIFFDAEQLERSKVHIEIDIASIKTGSMDRDAQAKSQDWFDVKTYPQAIFEAGQFVRGDVANHYIAHGVLTLHGVKLPVDLPFSLEATQSDTERSSVEMKADIDLNRLEFNIGQGQWQKTDAISDKVTISISLHASEK